MAAAAEVCVKVGTVRPHVKTTGTASPYSAIPVVLGPYSAVPPKMCRRIKPSWSHALQPQPCVPARLHAAANRMRPATGPCPALVCRRSSPVLACAAEARCSKRRLPRHDWRANETKYIIALGGIGRGWGTRTAQCSRATGVVRGVTSSPHQGSRLKLSPVRGFHDA